MPVIRTPISRREVELTQAKYAIVPLRDKPAVGSLVGFRSENQCIPVTRIPLARKRDRHAEVWEVEWVGFWRKPDDPADFLVKYRLVRPA